MTEYQKLCISKRHKGKNVSEKTRQKLSNSHLGQIPWNKGKKEYQVAWNKGIHTPRKKYKFIKDKEIIEIDNLKKYCIENGLVYGSMIALNKGTGFYGKKGRYKEYECFTK